MEQLLSALLDGIWNLLRGRREVLMTFDLQSYSQAKFLLREQSIRYWTRSVGRNRHLRGYRGSAFERLDQSVQYQIFVHRSDYDRAMRALGRR